MPGSRFHIFLIFLIAAVLLGVSAGCNDDITVTQPDTVVHGTVAARVRGFPGNTPLAGAAYQMIGTSVTGAADADGVIHLADVTEGYHTLRISSAGYASTLYTFEISGGSTTPHVQNDVPLVEKSAGLVLTLYKATDGTPAPNAVVALRWTASPPEFQPAGSYAGFVIEDPSAPSSVRTDANGQVVLAGVPATTLNCNVFDYDSNGDGIGDSSLYESVYLPPGATSAAAFTMRGGGYPYVISSNVPISYNGPQAFSESVAYFVFGDVMDTSTTGTRVELYDGSNQEVPVTYRWANPVRLEVDLPVLTLIAGTNYTITLTTRTPTSPQVSSEFSFTWDPE